VTFGPEDDSQYQAGGSEVDDLFPEVDHVMDQDADADAAPVAEWEPEQEYHTALPPKVEAWRKRSAAGAILTGFALGLQEALETKRQDPSIVIQTSGDPPKDLPVEADFEYGRPRQSVVSIRPWLLQGAGGERDPEDAGSPPDDGEAGSGPR
jgi:hypothetical protein